MKEKRGTWKRERTRNTLSPEHLMGILKGIYPEDVANELYKNLVGEDYQEQENRKLNDCTGVL